MGAPTPVEMPDHISWKQVEGLVRALGFTPHQVRELKIDNTSSNPVVTVQVHANSQSVTRVYDTGRGFSGVRIGPTGQEQQ